MPLSLSVSQSPRQIHELQSKADGWGTHEFVELRQKSKIIIIKLNLNRNYSSLNSDLKLSKLPSTNPPPSA